MNRIECSLSSYLEGQRAIAFINALQNGGNETNEIRVLVPKNYSKGLVGNEVGVSNNPDSSFDGVNLCFVDYALEERVVLAEHIAEDCSSYCEEIAPSSCNYVIDYYIVKKELDHESEGVV